MIKIYSTSIIYIVCPPQYATGGTELLHQLAHKLQENHFTVFMYYLPNNYVNPIHQRFEHYNINFKSTVDDDKNHVLIMPEIYIDLFRSSRFIKIRKVIWWLSVDDYVNRINDIVSKKSRKPFFKLKRFIGRYKFPDLKFLSRSRILHLVQSEYASNFLKSNNIKVEGYLSDYLNREFFTKKLSDERKDHILYNPLKGYEFTKKLIAEAPHLHWVALEKMTPAEVADSLNHSKVYIDFGHHPGKDRFPREAAIMGCCVITGKKGSASFFEDIPIPDEFKFDESNTAPLSIITKIEQCLQNYPSESLKFHEYVEMIKMEEKKFEADILTIFSKEV